MLYHAIVILSCRAPSTTRSGASVTPRESLSALSITTIIAEFRNRIPYLTFVPYAASLALRTTYRELTACSVPTVRARLFKQLRENCRILRGFEEMYRPASVIVGLVDRLTTEVDRAAGNPLRPSSDEPASRAPSMQVSRDDANRGTGGDSAANDGLPLASALPDSLTRLDAFESLDFDFDFDALDAAFGDYTYPCLSTDFT